MKIVVFFYRVISKLDLILLLLTLIVGLYGAIASSYSSFADLIDPKTFVKPCWLDSSAADPHSTPATNTTSTPAANETFF